MAFEMPLDQIKHLRTLLRKEANLSWFEPEKEENAALPKLPSVAETIAKLDPSPPYLRCKNCNGRLIRDLQSFICVFCGTNPQKELPPEPIKFKNTIGYRWLLESLQLDGSEMVASVVDENEWNRGKNESKDEIPLSELLDLEIRWPSEEEKARTSTSELTEFQGSSLNLDGVDLDSYFDRRESDSDVFDPNLPSVRKVGAASDNTFKANENLSLFQHIKASEVAAGSREAQSGDSFSSWEASFTSASSGPVHEESKTIDHSKVELDTIPGFWKDSVGVKKNDDLSSSASMQHDYFQDDKWRTSNSEVHTEAGKSKSTVDFNSKKTAESANGSSRNLDWMQGDQWQGSDSKTTDTVATAEDKYSFDEWNDFKGSASMQDTSSTISGSKATDLTGNIVFSVDLNDKKTADDANRSSDKDFNWMQDQWQDNNKTMDTISANEAADSFDAWDDFPPAANTERLSFGVSNSDITDQSDKLTQDHNDAKTTENATGSSSNFDWMQDNQQWQGSDNKATGIVTTNELAESFDTWNDFTGSTISQNPSSGASDSAVTAQTGKSEIIADLNDIKTEVGANASSRRSFDWIQDDQWQTSNNKTTDTRTTSAIDSFDVWNDFTSLAGTQDHSSNVWKQTVNQTSAEKTSEANLLSSSNNSHDIDFSGFSQHDLFSGQFGGSWSSLSATSSNRVDSVDNTRGNSEDVSTAVESKDNVEMLMSQMHDLSFMLENNLSIPPK